MKFISSAHIICVTGALVWGACSKKDDDESSTSAKTFKVAPKLSRLNVANIETSLKLVDSEFLTNKVNITSFKYPIGGIQITDSANDDSTGSGSNTFDVYRCAGTSNDACLIDLASGDALSNLLVGAPALETKIGTFNKLAVSPCYTGGKSEDIRAKLTATVDIQGTTYYTNVAQGLSTTGPAEEVTFAPGGGCGAVFPLLETIEIKADEIVTKEDGTEEAVNTTTSNEIPVQLYFDIANVASASGGTSNTGASLRQNCVGTTSQLPNVCLNFPQITGTVDTAQPTVKRFLVDVTGGAKTWSPTILGLYEGTGGRVFGAYTRNYYNDSVYTGIMPEFVMGPAFKSFKANADGSLEVKAIYDWLVFPNFKKETHTGTVTIMERGEGDSFSNPDTYDYTATLIE